MSNSSKLTIKNPESPGKTKSSSTEPGFFSPSPDPHHHHHQGDEHGEEPYHHHHHQGEKHNGGTSLFSSLKKVNADREDGDSQPKGSGSDQKEGDSGEAPSSDKSKGETEDDDEVCSNPEVGRNRGESISVGSSVDALLHTYMHPKQGRASGEQGEEEHSSLVTAFEDFVGSVADSLPGGPMTLFWVCAAMMAGMNYYIWDNYQRESQERNSPKSEPEDEDL